MAKPKKIYRVVGVIHTALSPKYDVDTNVGAYSKKQAKLKAFFMLRQESHFSQMDNKTLMGKVKKLKVIEE